MHTYALAIDIGGTFTDAVLLRDDGRAWVDKKLTTYGNLLDGFFAAVEAVLDQAGVSAGAVTDVVVHATTLVTNCVIERKGAKTALLATEGFADLLFIRDESRSNIFDNQLEFTAPLIAPEHAYGVPERILADGSVLTPLDTRRVAAIVDELQAQGVQSIAVCLLHAYMNDTHERGVAAIVRERAPEMFLSLSSEVAPQIREYWRASTTAINAYTMPLTLPYLQALVGEMRRRGFRQEPLIMLSSGGVIGAGVAGRFPVRMIESGPAAGALAGAYFARQRALPMLLSFDMGGTTAKASFIRDGEPLVTGIFEIDRKYRFQAGSGLPVIVPCVDIIEIGAGGGSIARVDGMGLLTVGPQSAGSEPGPVCYGRGGSAPTVTDADLVLGMLDADGFLGGTMRLEAAAAYQAIGALGRRLGMSEKATAVGVYKLVCDAMAAAVRSHAADNGLDWRNLRILAFGGAGPVHACYVAELLEGHEVVFPPLASVLSAYGTLVSPTRLDLARGYMCPLDRLDWSAVEQLRDALVEQGRAELTAAGCRPEEIEFGFSADMRYQGQHYEINVELPPESLAARDPRLMRERFETAYERQYGVTLRDVGVEIVTWRLCIHGSERRYGAVTRTVASGTGAARSRRVCFPTGPQEVPVLARAALPAGRRIAGPALIEESDTTIVILPGWDFMLDDSGCVVAERRTSGG